MTDPAENIDRYDEPDPPSDGDRIADAQIDLAFWLRVDAHKAMMRAADRIEESEFSSVESVVAEAEQAISSLLEDVGRIGGLTLSERIRRA